MNNRYEIMVDIGVITDVELDEFNDMFTDWIESNGWCYGGGMHYSDDQMNDRVRNID